ncbi:MAG TPA: threonine/serine exporter family protein [Rhodanobacteraceae bacterium]|nr:threonine/serine exporter family protein [Rhodanobacteraceae bacterium]
MSEPTSSLKSRVSFLIELARRLHQYGTTALRLEDALSGVAQRLGLHAEVWSSPTAIILSFGDDAQGADGVAQVTQVVRLPPGDVNLARLCEVDDIADDVIERRIGIDEGVRQLRQLTQPLDRAHATGMVLGYALSVFGFAGVIGGTWADALAAAGIGAMIGGIVLLAQHWPRLAPATEAVTALLATAVASVVSIWLWPVHVSLVVLAAVIVLVPGMMLTTAVRELSAVHLVAGVSRLFGALSSMLKLIFGYVVVMQFVAWMGLRLPDVSAASMTGWALWLALVLGSFGFALVFLARRRDWLLVALSAMAGYLMARYAGAEFGAGAGVFIGGLVLGALSNVYARVTSRPGALIREPGIILLVPGSVGYRTLVALAENDVGSGGHTAVILVTILVALVAGLLFGDMLVAPRRSL